MAPIRSRQPVVATPPNCDSPLLADRVLMSLGCDPIFIAGLLGDLSEEYTDRAARDGICAARCWYVREMVRSTPHVVWNAIRHGTPSARARLAAYTLAFVVTLSVLTMAWLTRNGPPARLVAGAGNNSEGIVVNNLRPVQLSMRVLDAAGNRLERTDVRYLRLSGVPIPVSTRGVVKCTRPGDAVVRAALGALTTDVVVHCQPVRALRSASWGDGRQALWTASHFVVGETARTFGVDAIGLDGQPVTRIVARLRVVDSTVATLDGGQLRPLRPGFTPIEVTIGDHTADAPVTVFERVRTFEGLRPDQRWVVAPIHLTRGASLRWPLPTGDFSLAFGADSSEMPTTWGFSSSPIAQSPIIMSVAGPIMCLPELRPGVLGTHCLARAPGATLTLAHSGQGASREIVGVLALEREEQR